MQNSTAAQRPAGPDARHPLFPEEDAPNTLPEFAFCATEGEHVFRLEVLKGTVSFGKMLIRKG